MGKEIERVKLGSGSRWSCFPPVTTLSTSRGVKHRMQSPHHLVFALVTETASLSKYRRVRYPVTRQRNRRTHFRQRCDKLKGIMNQDGNTVSPRHKDGLVSEDVLCHAKCPHLDRVKKRGPAVQCMRNL